MCISWLRGAVGIKKPFCIQSAEVHRTIAPKSMARTQYLSQKQR